MLGAAVDHAQTAGCQQPSEPAGSLDVFGPPTDARAAEDQDPVHAPSITETAFPAAPGVVTGQPPQHARADVGQRPVVAMPVAARKPRQQRRVLARVVGVVGGRVDAVVGGQHEQVAVAQQLKPVVTAVSISLNARANPAMSWRCPYS